ncbi:MAG: hypothetical protein KAS78_02590 [Candidatus Pacebacteria bacterium]|nr:hypothetical protein [Candidatus Paceibacterota bacterium]
MAYYIKCIWAPGGQDGLDDGDRTEFAEGQERAAQRFIKCDGFFLYETGHKNKDKIGAKAIFAQGTVQMPSKVIDSQDRTNYSIEGGEEKSFPYHVKINLNEESRVNSLNGVSLNTIRRVLKKPKERMQRQGGLIEITKDQFNELCLELEKCSRKRQK